jgi:hypothetical protein
MPSKPTYRISIEAEFGSDIQRDVSLRVLREYLTGWEQSVVSAHKKNKVIISEHEIPSKPHSSHET